MLEKGSALLALLMAFTPTNATPQASRAEGPDRLLPFDAVERRLPNGLVVIVVPTGFPNLVSLQIPVQAGSRNEVEPGKSGFAHFFEHMMFRGTRAYPADAYQAVMTRAGARGNAYTTDDYTDYHVTFAKQDLETILKLEADRFQNLDYSVPDFKTESRAVLGEYEKNSANPVRKLIEVQRENAFRVHTYRHTTMGFLADIQAMPEQFEYSREFFSRWYRPEHAALIVAGDVTADEVMPLVERYWGPWKPGHYRAEIPAEPRPAGPVTAKVPWGAPTQPWVSVAFHTPGFSETDKDWAALDVLADLSFGPTSALYRKLVDDEQKVDQLSPYLPGNVDPYLLSVLARVKKPEDTPYVRNQILATFAAACAAPPSAARLADAKANGRYSLLRGLDNTEAIAATLARFVRYRRSYQTLDRLYRTYDALTPSDLQAAACRYFVDTGLVQTTLARDPLPPALDVLPALASLAPPQPQTAETAQPGPAAAPARAPAATEAVASSPALPRPIVLRSKLPQLDVKLLFRVGSAHDPKGKEGLAALSAAMIADAGSRDLTIDAIRKALYPMAASFEAQVDKEMTTFTARVHRDNWERFAAIALPQLSEPGFRPEDFARIKDQQRSALVLDLRTNNEEELGKEQLQDLVFAGTPYAHPVLGTVAGIEAITLDDVKTFVAKAYTRAALDVGLAGDLPAGLEAQLAGELARLPAGPPLPAPAGVAGRPQKGFTVDLIEKETRATAISLGHPIPVTRSHPDFPALYLARTWLGEHRSSLSHLYRRIREARGMNYGDYAYIEAFPRGMFQFFPDPNLARRAQLFEIWIRPVQPENARMALRIAIHELRRLTDDGLSQADFESTREYLEKSVYLMTATQDQQLGYALDSRWYGIPEFTSYLRDGLAKLSLADVNAAIRRHLSGRDLQVVMVTKEAQGLADALVADDFSPIHYDGAKRKELLAEDQVVGALKLGIRREAITITPVEQVFAK